MPSSEKSVAHQPAGVVYPIAVATAQLATATTAQNDLAVVCSSVQTQIKQFIDDINIHKSRTHYILDSLLQNYNTNIKKFMNVSKKLETISQLLEESGEEMLEASKDLSTCAYSRVVGIVCNFCYTKPQSKLVTIFQILLKIFFSEVQGFLTYLIF